MMPPAKNDGVVADDAGNDAIDFDEVENDVADVAGNDANDVDYIIDVVEDAAENIGVVTNDVGNDAIGVNKVDDCMHLLVLSSGPFRLYPFILVPSCYYAKFCLPSNIIFHVINNLD